MGLVGLMRLMGFLGLTGFRGSTRTDQGVDTHSHKGTKRTSWLFKIIWFNGFTFVVTKYIPRKPIKY